MSLAKIWGITFGNGLGNYIYLQRCSRNRPPVYLLEKLKDWKALACPCADPKSFCM